MRKHFPRNTLSVTAWCNRCAAHTPHRVDDRRVGPCLNCIERAEELRKAAHPAPPRERQEALKFS